MKKELSRRELLFSGVKHGLALMLLSSCKNSNQNNTSSSHEEIRASMKYVDNTSIPSRKCDNCKLYVLPKDGSDYGSCKVVPGPIHPQGYCKVWIHRM